MKSFEVKEDWSWRNWKLKIFEVEKVCGWRSLKFPILDFIVIFGRCGKDQKVFGFRVRFNNFIVTYSCRLSTFVLKIQLFLFFLYLACFCPCWAHNQDILGVRVRFKNFIVTNLCRLLTLVLQVHPYLYYFNLAPFGVFFALFRPFGAVFCLGWCSKRFLKPIDVDY